MNKIKGFTIIELIAVIMFLLASGVLFFVQKNNIEVASRDSQRKTAINTIYHGLEESFYKQNHYYPSVISSSNLTTVPAEMFIDPSGNALNATGSTYRYEATGCVNDECTGYSLRADLENEADFIKENKQN